ncbi:MAG: M23 family metallopeptidase [Colwellia sp.]|nr:M23 family metallopeptidase [Colwellia sp.]MCW8863443.1 M23 family metallopeptidase [Colwellia sp.]MCW9081417.1 M23 family metallopeptidase [Colwellia sp.]
MFNSLKISSLCFIIATTFSAHAEIQLSGEVKQGGLMLGKTQTDNTVMLNERVLPVSDNGDYVFAFSRDDEKKYRLKIISPNGSIEEKLLVPAKREYNISRVEGIKKSIMNPNKKANLRAKQDREMMVAVRKVSSDLTDFSKGFIAPRKARITGVYGSQRFYNGVPKSPHYGVDYAGAIGSEVKAPASGKVLLWVPDMFYSGGTLVIDHGHGITSNFLHLSDSLVNVGDKVKQGQVIAKVGNSGRVTGPHLDWRMNWHNVRFDPQLAMKVIPLN